MNRSNRFRPQLETLEARATPTVSHAPTLAPGAMSASRTYQNSVVTPPTVCANGESYARESAQWWQYTLSQPTTHNPFFDTAPANTHQSGHVWFLGGSFTGKNAVRNVTVADNTSLFVPIVNTEFERITTPNLKTDAQLRKGAKDQVDAVLSSFATLDGHTIHGYRTQSPFFNVTLPDKNLFETFGYNAPAGTKVRVVSDGIWLNLAPMAVGQHTLKFGATVPAGANQPPFTFTITYHINVVHRHA